MSYLENVGEVSTDGEWTIRWTIPQYLQMPQEPETTLMSPTFTFRFEDECWLYVYPNGCEYQDDEGWIGIACGIPFLPTKYTATFSVVDRQGREILSTMAEVNYPCYDKHKWFQRSELEARSDEILPEGRLHIVVRKVLPQGRGRSVELHEESGLHKLSELWKDLYLQGRDCDFTIKVRGREFRVHQLVLKVRIPAFYATLADMAENTEGVVSMEDCDPDVFHEFLLFVYSGRVENMSSDNMCELYVLADKYDLQDLKNMCLNFIKCAISVEMICDIVSLATTHNEAELLNLATDFFAANAEQILETAKWQQFLKKNPEKGNQLFIKTLKLGKRKRSLQ